MRYWLLLSVGLLAAADGKLLPLLNQHCGGCHTGTQAQGGLSFNSVEALQQGGKHGPARDLIVAHMTGEKTPQMPLGAKLPAAVIAEIKAEIAKLPVHSGTSDAHWTWLRTVPAKPQSPPVQNQSWPRNAIDHHVLATLESQHLTPAPEANKRTLLRRLYFDLIGLPPSPEQTRAFLDDPDPAAYEKQIDKLLADSRYGERWGRHWLDLVRYAESDGFAIDGERPTAWRYRDYVIRAFNSDKPYDLFVQEQIAGDEYRGKKATTQADRMIAQGFLRFAPWEADANSKKQLRQDFLNDITGTVGSVFLGLTTGCAQCHDHKYDPIKQKDYYRLQAFFAGTAIADLPVAFDAVENPKER